MDMKPNLENVFPGLPSYYTSRNPPSEVQVKWVLDFIRKKLWNDLLSLPVEDEILEDFGIINIEEDFPEKYNEKEFSENLAIIIKR